MPSVPNDSALMGWESAAIVQAPAIRRLSEAMVFSGTKAASGVGAMGDSVPAWSLPSITFILAAAIAFATGTSFGTMTVLMPLALPMALGMETPPGTIALATSASVLSGAVWGDHCSPISDTTVLSSTGTGCDHDAHVKTQLPYAIVVGIIAVLLGTLPAGLGVPWLLLLPIGVAACAAAVWGLGRPPAT